MCHVLVEHWEVIRTADDRRSARSALPRALHCREASNVARQAGSRTTDCRLVWPKHFYEGRPVEPVFTTPGGELVSRQHIDTLLRRVGAEIGLDVAHLGTHTGRRSLITALYTNDVALDDVQHHIGHSDSRTTAGYVASLGSRPQRTAAIAAEIMDRPVKK